MQNVCKMSVCKIEMVWRKNSKSQWSHSKIQNIVFDEPKLGYNASNGANLSKIGSAVFEIWGNKQKEKKNK